VTPTTMAASQDQAFESALASAASAVAAALAISTSESTSTVLLLDHLEQLQTQLQVVQREQQSLQEDLEAGEEAYETGDEEIDGEDDEDGEECETDEEEMEALNLKTEEAQSSPTNKRSPARSIVSVEDIEASMATDEVVIEEPDEMFGVEEGRSVYGCWGACKRAGRRSLWSKGERIPRAARRPTKSTAIALNDPMCEPNTLVYCLFRYRRNRALVAALLEKLEYSKHPNKDSYTMHLCYLLLVEPLAQPLETWLISRCKTSLHFALQVYWFCQGMVEDHQEHPGPSNYKRFLRMQRELQTSVGGQHEEKARSISSTSEARTERNPSGQMRRSNSKGKLRSLERKNQALSDALEVRQVFFDVTRFVESITQVSVTLRQTEPRSEREQKLVDQLEAMKQQLPEQAHLPAKKFGTFMRVLTVLPEEAQSFSTRERNPYMLYLEVVEKLETSDGLQDTSSVASSKHDKAARRRSRKAILTNAILAPGRVTLRAGAKTGEKLKQGVSFMATKGKAGVGGVIDGQRERHAKHVQRREAALAQENDPFSITETPVEKTARMQQAAPKEVGLAGGRGTPDTNALAADATPEAWRQREERIRAQSSYARDELGWQLAAVIVKADDDLRQEMFCMHLITLFRAAFIKAGLDALADGLRPYSIQPVSSSSGVIEALVDATSIAETKRMMLKHHNTASLEACYRERFGSAESVVTFEQAQKNCMHSVAAYALVQYVLQLKDRHNGNILIDSSGRMVHIDFAYMLGWAPGGITFEKPSFKLTKDICDVWGGRGSPLWDDFVSLFVEGLAAIQTHHEFIMRDVEVLAACGARFPFLTRTTLPKMRILKLLRRRFKIYKGPLKLRRYGLTLIDEAYDNFWTHMYAKFQLLTNGIPP